MSELAARADAQHAGYPHMQGRWAGWLTGRVKRRVYRFGVLYFDAGEATLVDPDGPDGDPGRVCYSFRVMVEVTLPADRVEITDARTAK
jgi:hypothetical protein